MQSGDQAALLRSLLKADVSSLVPNFPRNPLRRMVGKSIGSTSTLDSYSLCSICETIEFSLLKFTWPIPPWIAEAEALSYEAYPSYDLGSVDEVLKRADRCVFCCAVSDAFYDWVETQEDGEVIELAHMAGTCKARMVIEGYIDQTERPDLGDLLRLLLTILMADGEELCVSFQAVDEPSKSVSAFCESDLMTIHTGIAYGGRTRPNLADVRLFQKWLALCGNLHGKDCQVQMKGCALTRLIDVQKRCIVEVVADDMGSYLALSYVWGHAKVLLLKKENRASLMLANALKDKNLPQTISDAMLLTKKLGERYLWVDSLCIVQDDDADKAEFITRMDLIYSQALLTIVAAAGSDANAGLPGMRNGTRDEQVSCKVKDVSLVCALHSEPNDFDNYLSFTTWNSRGWTMQERVLSRRALIFTSEQVYWECQQSSWCEEAHWEATDLPKLHRAAPESTLRISQLTAVAEEKIDELKSPYRQVVMQYTQRQFSFESDIFDAFKGIMSVITQNSGSAFFWALPESIFSAALSWYGAVNVRREALYPLRTAPKPDTCIPFPSWCWMGWSGMALFPPLNVHSKEIIFFRLADDRSLVTIREMAPKGEIPDDGKRRDYEGLRSQWKDSSQTVVHMGDIPSSTKMLPEAPSFLFFWTSSCPLLIVKNEGSTCEVQDPHGTRITSLKTNLPRSFPEIEGHGVLHEFIVLARDLTVFSPSLMIALILRKGDIAYRQSVAQIAEQSWIAQPNRVWKMVTLG
jgi:hypothetical protein